MDTAKLSAIFGAIAAIAAIVAVLIPLIYNKIKSRTRTLIKVKRIQSTDDPDLLQALELYSRNIPNNERDNPENIVRWLQEIQIETMAGKCKLKDYFLITKVREKVCGLLYAQYYPHSRLMFISYMVVDRDIPEARWCAASNALLRYLSHELHKTLKNCEGIVFELEYPKKEKKREQILTCRARIRHFCALARMQNIVVKKIKIDYRQPKLSLWENRYSEEKQALMYGRTRPPHIATTIPRDEVVKVLSFFYNDIYGDHFEDDPIRNTKFRHYLKKLYETMIRDLPDDILVS